MSEKVKEKKLVWSDYWLGEDYEEESNFPFDEDLIFESKDSDLNTTVFDVNTLKLASGRRAIANFVSILTGEDIPVYFWDGNKTGATNGKVVYLSANIVKKEDFDPAVGLSLHEGTHILLTDFELIKTLWGRISELYKLGKEIGINKDRVKEFAYLMVNYVEDRYIDDYIFRTAPGYRPYYIALYNKYFNNDRIGEMLDGKLLRSPTLSAYEARIINLTNPHTDLEALPGLREIAKELSLKDIARLKTTKDRIKTAVEITKIVFKNIKDFIEEQKAAGQSHEADPNKKQKHEIFFDIRMDESEDSGENESTDSIPNENGKPSEKTNSPKEPESENTEKKDLDGKDESDDAPALPKNPLDTEDDIIGGEWLEVETPDIEKDEKKEDLEYGDVSAITKKELKKIKIILDNQKMFIEDHKHLDKIPVTTQQKQILDAIEKSGIILVPVGMDLQPGNGTAYGVDCVVVKKMTKELMFSGMFPLCLKYSYIGKDYDPDPSVGNAVTKGIILGTMLGKKLQLRREINESKYLRRKVGKIYKRHLHEWFNGNESILHTIARDKYNKANLHISVDSSESMSDFSKWEKTITTVVALAKAGSMIDNLRVCISFRTTIEQRGVDCGYSSLPYIVLAYDSEKDKFSKIKNLFPYLNACGATPEGLCFEAIMDNLICRKAGEIYYFLNISDGEPCYSYNSLAGQHISYGTQNGTEHTRKQYKKILESGVKGMSYFIDSCNRGYSNGNKSAECFKRMYGNDAKFIDVNSVTAIARTMNEMFLTKE